MCPPLGNTLSCMASVCIYHPGFQRVSVHRDASALFIPKSLLCQPQLSEALSLGTLMENQLPTDPTAASFWRMVPQVSTYLTFIIFLEPSCFSSARHFFPLQRKSVRCVSSSGTKQPFLPAQQSLVPPAEDNSCAYCSQQLGCKGRGLGYV